MEHKSYNSDLTDKQWKTAMAYLAQQQGPDRLLKWRNLVELLVLSSVVTNSSVSEICGSQEGAQLTMGTLGYTCYHPLFCFDQFRDPERALLREGNVAQCAGTHRNPYCDADIHRFFRGDATFVNPDIYPLLEEKSYLYAIRLPANQNFQRAIEHLFTCPVG